MVPQWNEKSEKECRFGNFRCDMEQRRRDTFGWFLRAQKNHIEIIGNLPDGAGTLRWDYRLAERETELSVSLKDSNLQSAFLLLPFQAYPDAKLTLSGDRLICERNGRKAEIVFSSSLHAELIPAKGKGYTTLLKIAFPSNGSTIRIAFRNL